MSAEQPYSAQARAYAEEKVAAFASSHNKNSFSLLGCVIVHSAGLLCVGRPVPAAAANASIEYTPNSAIFLQHGVTPSSFLGKQNETQMKWLLTDARPGVPTGYQSFLDKTRNNNHLNEKDKVCARVGAERFAERIEKGGFANNPTEAPFTLGAVVTEGKQEVVRCVICVCILTAHALQCTDPRPCLMVHRDSHSMRPAFCSPPAQAPVPKPSRTPTQATRRLRPPTSATPVMPPPPPPPKTGRSRPRPPTRPRTGMSR